jgi:hypothetical protein
MPVRIALNLPGFSLSAPLQSLLRLRPAGKGNPRHREDRHRGGLDSAAHDTWSPYAMTRELTPLYAADLSAFAKHLRTSLATRIDGGTGLPGHVEMLNLLARAAGHRNVQALKAAVATRPATPSQPPRWHGPKHPELTAAADRVLRLVDDHGRLLRWPAKRAEQVLALWCVWLPFDGKRRYSEREVNEVLNAHHAFGDHCLLRRELVEADLLARTPGGEQYRKCAARPSQETAALLRAVRAKGAA